MGSRSPSLNLELACFLSSIDPLFPSFSALGLQCVSMLLCPQICTHIFIHTAFLNAKKHEKVFAHFLQPSLFNPNLRSVFLLLSIHSNQECIKHIHLRDVLASFHLKYSIFCADVMVPIPNPSSGRAGRRVRHSRLSLVT